MCLTKEVDSPPKEAVSPRSPWAKLLNRRNYKPKIPRNVASSARVNLNKCWSKLGELISNTPPRVDLPSQKTAYSEVPVIHFSNFFYPVDPVKPVRVEENDNAENQNIVNSGRFELISDDIEINDNMANEVREICYKATENCFVCNFSY